MSVLRPDPSAPDTMFQQLLGIDRVHFVGIGGAGMCGIAEVLLDFRLQVSGSDQAASENTERLVELGAEIFIGHSGDHVRGADLVVRSSAVPDDNPEVVEAHHRGIAVIRRAEMLAELMRLKYGIAIAGTHGKTTTTSLVGTLLTEAGLDPTVIVGGRLRVSGTGARIGRSRYLVAEADEFDRSFLRLMPVIAVITTIDVDHLDTYRDLDDILEAFRQFADRVPFFGQVIACLDDENVQTLLPRLRERRVVTYGFSPQADLIAQGVRAENGLTHFTVRHAVRGLLGEVNLPIPGRHNVQNALATICVALAVGLDFETIARGLASFRGVHRRFERLGTFAGATVVDDYAHHPAEVAATLAAARQVFPQSRVLVVFQPHLYSRTQQHAEAFGRALLAADVAWVTDVYGSREQPVPGVTGEMVVEAARAAGHRHVEYCRDWRDLPERLRAEVRPGDALFTLGAGDIYRLGHELPPGGSVDRHGRDAAGLRLPPPGAGAPAPPPRAGAGDRALVRQGGDPGRRAGSARGLGVDLALLPGSSPRGALRRARARRLGGRRAGTARGASHPGRLARRGAPAGRRTPVGRLRGDAATAARPTRGARRRAGAGARAARSPRRARVRRRCGQADRSARRERPARRSGGARLARRWRSTGQRHPPGGLGAAAGTAAVGGGIRSVEWLGEGELAVHTAASPSRSWCGGGDRDGLGRLEAAMAEMERRGIAIGQADLRFPRRVVIQPAAHQANAGQSAQQGKTEG